MTVYVMFSWSNKSLEGKWEKNGNRRGCSPLHPIGGQRFKGSKVFFFTKKAMYYTIIREPLACE